MIRVLCIVGPTASGKSALAVELAERVSPRGEVVSTDSMQIYRGMDIGTATPSMAERRGIPHHLLDRVDPTEAFSVAEYQTWARDAIAQVGEGSAVPVVVGGSGLYVRAVLDDLQFPGTDAVVRSRLEMELAERGPMAMHSRLSELDPAAALAILPSNGRRIVRALEVVEITGRPFTASLPRGGSLYDVVMIGLEVPRDVLDARISARVDAMWDAGFVDEVRSLGPLGPTASRALGYQQIADALAGHGTLEQARRQTIDATRRFARRQQRWFRADDRVRWLQHDSSDLVDQALAVWGTST
jgi:tRNA dimethylallyltransferase